MSIDDVLFHAQSTTSLYDQEGNPNRYIATLSEAEPVYKPLPPANPAAGNNAKDVAPEIVVQVRKRQGVVQILLDGHVSKGTAHRDHANTTKHNLTWHRGMHEDDDTNTRVFSPLAVVAAVEDGQHAFQDVTVSVVQQYAENRNLVLDPTVIAEARLADHRVDDVRFSVVRVPYPLACPNPPALTVPDDQQQRNKRAGEAVYFLYTLVTTIDPFSYLNTPYLRNTDLTMVERQWTLLGNRAWLGLYAAASRWAPGMLLSYAMGTSASLVDEMTGGLWVVTGWSLLAAASAISYTAESNANLFETEDDGAARQIIYSSLVSGVGKYLRLYPDPGLRQTRFTIAELAAVLETLAIRRKPKPGATPEAFNRKDTEEFRKEQVVWNWLLDTSGKLVLDTGKVAPSAAHTSQLYLRIAVDDSLACTAAQQYHEIHCDRDDSHLLGAAAAGALEDMHRLYKAIFTLIERNQEQIDENGKYGWLWRMYDEPVEFIRSKVAPPKEVLAAFEEAGADEDTQTWTEWFKSYASWAWTKKETETTQVPPGSDEAQKEALNKLEKLKGELKDLQVKGAKKSAFRWLKGLFNQQSDAGTEGRTKILRAINSGLQDKLINTLFLPDSPGYAATKAMEGALADRRTGLVAAGAADWSRRMHPRARARVTSLFATIPESATGRVDVTSSQAYTRVYSEYHDAARWFSASMVSGNFALRRFVREWEANTNTRIKLTCVCSALTNEALLTAFAPEHAYNTLTLTTPADIQFSGAVAAPTEHSQRHIRLVVRRAQQECDKSILEALGLEHSDASLLACQIFGDLWIDELVALWNLGDSRQAEMLEKASFRATERLRAAATFLQELVLARNAPSSSLDSDDIAPSNSDISFVATQPGRDAGRFMDRLFSHQNYIALRASMVPRLRDAARAALRACTAFTRNVPTALPHEPAASLFGDKFDGVAAWLRIDKLPDTVKPTCVVEATSAYPSYRLLGAAATTTEARAQAAGRVPTSRVHDTPVLQLVQRMRFRLASLRMDPAPALPVASASPTSTIDELAQRLSQAQVSSTPVGLSFYVPFGFGDARPPPTLPPCAAPMFGSVPVFGAHLLTAFETILNRGQPPLKPAANPLHVRLAPVFGCLKPPKLTHDDNEAESVHPNVVQVSVENGDIVVRYAASSLPRYDDADATVPGDHGAHGLVRSEGTTKLASLVTSIAWNAERVVQAVVAALASADDATVFDAVELSFVLPPDDRGSAPWYTKPNNPMATAQKRNRRQRKVDTLMGLLRQLLKHYKRETSKPIEDLKTWDVYNKLTKLEGAEVYVAYKAYTDGMKGLDAIGPEKKDNETNDQWKARLETSNTWAAQARAKQALLDTLLASSAASTIVNDYNNIGSDKASVADLEAMRVKLEKQVKDMGKLEEELKSLLKDRTVFDGSFQNTARLLKIAAAVDAADTAAEAATNRHKVRQRRALVGALGLGMGMLAPLLGPQAPLPCGAITLDDTTALQLAQNEVAVESTLMEAFRGCSALRLSEACLVVSRSLT